MTEKSDESIPQFYQRFNILISQNKVQEHFINRVVNFLQVFIPGFEKISIDESKPTHVLLGLVNVAAILGLKYKWDLLLSDYIGKNFYNCLQALETLYQVYLDEEEYQKYAEKVEDAIKRAISLSEVDLGIEWRDRAFWPSGAKILDQALINENLRWLSDKGYQDVIVPFEKGLNHFLEALNKPERLSDTITDVYEAVEALARIVTGNNKELSGNAELFISKLKLNDYYKKMIKDYVDFACNYRHAVELGKKREIPLRNEVEAFIYTSGLFMRLAIQQLVNNTK